MNDKQTRRREVRERSSRLRPSKANLKRAPRVGALRRGTAKRKRLDEAFREMEEKLKALMQGSSVPQFIIGKNHQVTYWNRAIEILSGISAGDILGTTNHWKVLYPSRRPCLADLILDGNLEGIRKWYEGKHQKSKLIANGYEATDFFPNLGDGGLWLHFHASPILDSNHAVIGALETIEDITERKRIEAALEKRIVALTQPLNDAGGISFEDLFNLGDIQRLQDLFAEVFGVASLITRPDGTPITKQSNFTCFCRDFVRATPIGRANCEHSDARIGRYNSTGPNIQTCLSAGLCNAGASITAGGRHIANWLIGQVRNETVSQKRVMGYAR